MLPIDAIYHYMKYDKCIIIENVEKQVLNLKYREYLYDQYKKHRPASGEERVSTLYSPPPLEHPYPTPSYSPFIFKTIIQVIKNTS